jgi:hypothetical protein
VQANPRHAKLPDVRGVSACVWKPWWAVGGLAGLALLCPAFAAAKQPKPKRHCVVPAHWTVVGRDSQALVITAEVHVPDVDGEGTPGREQQWRYCPYSKDRFHVLVANTGIAGGYGDIIRVDQVALSGAFAAYDSSDVLGGGRYGVNLGIDVTDLLTGRDESARVLGDAFAHVLLAPPLAVWISQGDGNDWFVQAFEGRGDRTETLETKSGPDTGPFSDPFGDLELDRCVAGCSPSGATFAWWTDAGAWRSAPIT